MTNLLTAIGIIVGIYLFIGCMAALISVFDDDYVNWISIILLWPIYCLAAIFYDLPKSIVEYWRIILKPKMIKQKISKSEKNKEKNSTYTVIVKDAYCDFKTDNDEFDDVPTYIKVTYDSKGNIIKSEKPVEETIILNNSLIFGGYKSTFKFKGDDEYKEPSSFEEIQQFERICKVNSNSWEDGKKYTAYHGR